MLTEAQELARLQETLEEWRALGRPGHRIPERVWDEAIHLAERYSVGRVAKAAGLDHTKLKRLVDATREKSMPAVAREAGPTFVELLAASPGSRLSCRVEVTAATGGQMRAEISGLDGPGLGAMFREFTNF